MKKHLWLLFVLLLLISCGPSGGEPATEPQHPEATAVASTTVAPTTPSQPTEESAETTATNDDPVVAIFPATTVDEAAVIRERDWVHGATDPLVTIIEYGDFQ